MDTAMLSAHRIFNACLMIFFKIYADEGYWMGVCCISDTCIIQYGKGKFDFDKYIIWKRSLILIPLKFVPAQRDLVD